MEILKDVTGIQYVRPMDMSPERIVYVYDEYDENNKLIRKGIRRSFELDDIKDAEIIAKIQEVRDFILARA